MLTKTVVDDRTGNKLVITGAAVGNGKYFLTIKSSDLSVIRHETVRLEELKSTVEAVVADFKAIQARLLIQGEPLEALGFVRSDIS